MACSDNVIRAGLTIKHIDIDLLCAILDPNAEPLSIQPTVQRFEWGERACYRTPAKEFLLERISSHTTPRESGIGFSPEGPEILLCTEGSFMVSAVEMDQEYVESFMLRKRESCIVAGSCERLVLEGHGTVWRASIGSID
jgi:mannose-6-phosphate isomerase